MTIKDYRSFFINELTPIYDPLEAENFFSLLLEEYHSMKRVDLALAPEKEFTADEVTNWNAILDQLKKEIPIQYIIGSTHFCGFKFEVNPDVLIPRPETEELVEWVFSSHKNSFPQPQILDIGTGSGCIAIALALKFDNANVSALDVSVKALETARRNAQLNNVKINFVQRNILESDKIDGNFHLLVSNPPYVRMLEKDHIKNNVLENEPHLALFVEDEDALIFYRKISKLAMDSLVKGGWLYFEINQYLPEETESLLKNQGFINVELKKDIYENFRMIRCQKL
ncbi:MAG TPA: peptide chain release factor N(5)-glutamine methyltransferase [Flavobacterium sp.]|jgi:release factor glutamine methyltransferase